MFLVFSWVDGCTNRFAHENRGIFFEGFYTCAPQKNSVIPECFFLFARCLSWNFVSSWKSESNPKVLFPGGLVVWWWYPKFLPKNQWKLVANHPQRALTEIVTIPNKTQRYLEFDDDDDDDLTNLTQPLCGDSRWTKNRAAQKKWCLSTCISTVNFTLTNHLQFFQVTKKVLDLKNLTHPFLHPHCELFIIQKTIYFSGGLESHL